MTSTIYEFIASCAAGLEKLTSDEIKACGGMPQQRAVGSVGWQGTLESGYRMCLWSRFSSRIFCHLATFRVAEGDDIYLSAKEIDWASHMNSDMTFSLSSAITGEAPVTHSQYAALLVKDAIVDFFREKTKRRPNISKERADIKIHLHLEGETGRIFLDFSGESLHRRGYRQQAGEAPLKENLAAAVVALSGWNRDVKGGVVLIDPMCGSGTLLIEAALIWGDTAPGLSRKYYGFSGWLGHNENLWSRLVEEAVEREDRAYEMKWPSIIGYDCDAHVIEIAKKNIKNAGLEEKIHVEQADAAFSQRMAADGFVISNLPYGERLSEKEDLKYLYAGLGGILQQRFSGWRAGLLVTEKDLLDSFHLQNMESFKLSNGPLSCRLLTGTVAGMQGVEFITKPGSSEGLEEGADLYNRLAKNVKKLAQWARKNGVSCYRVYDRDLPEYNLAIDVYEKYFLVQEYAPPSSVEENIAKKRLSVALHVVRKFFNTGRERVFIRQRKRQRGKEQYRKKETKEKFQQVSEGGMRFLVNFTNYLDTGLFLDHRPVRMKIGQMSKGKNFLNLFAYTGTASVYAACGGALSTTTVDLSQQYIQWAKNNFLLNGLSLDRHKFYQQDSFSWLREADKIYDIIFIDPPTFANTKKKGLHFDIQRDHAALLLLALNVLSDTGIILFSTNYKGFTIEDRLSQRCILTDITEKTIPFDFQRSFSIHKCWEIRRKEGVSYIPKEEEKKGSFRSQDNKNVKRDRRKGR